MKEHSRVYDRWIMTAIALMMMLGFQDTHAQQQAVIGKTSYNFLVDTSTYSSTVGSPLLLFLHGRSLSGQDLNRVKRYGVLYAKNRGVNLPDALIVAPQTAQGWDADKLQTLLTYILENYAIDTSRIYVCGMSMGAYGTMDFVGKYPERIAAAVAICGGGNVNYADALATVPLWIQHGNADRAVPMSESKKIYSAIKKANPKADAKLTIIPGGTHGSVERLFHQQDIYTWMFSHSKK